jgi:DNA-binding GntR family transcriptional regulator
MMQVSLTLVDRGRDDATTPAAYRALVPVPDQPARSGRPAPAADSGALAAPSARVPAQPRRHSVRGQVLAALRAAITGGELAPGPVHSAPALAARYGVSATPVREAMQQLAAEGAVEVVPNRGFRVLALSARDRAELAEVRALLVVPVVLGLCGREELRGIAADVEDRAFLEALVGLSGNRQLVRVVAELQVRSAPRPSAPGTREALLDALREGDAPMAEALLRTLLAPR